MPGKPNSFALLRRMVLDAIPVLVLNPARSFLIIGLSIYVRIGSYLPELKIDEVRLYT